MAKTQYIGYRPTWVEINLNNLAYNFSQLRKMVAPEVKIMVTVKADAYGHGLIPIAKKLIACGVDYLGVASIDEGINLRRKRIKLPVLVLGMVLRRDIALLFEYNLIPTVCTEDLALALNAVAKIRRKIIKVHIKVDTGMGRLGVMPEDAQMLISRIHKLKFVNIEGIFTHLAVADTNKKFTFYQINLFNNLISKLNNQGIHVPLIHSANSIGLISYKECHFNMVRPGLVIYGLSPKEGLNLKLKPVLSLKTKVVYLKRVPGDYGISYGHTYTTKKATTIVTLPVGYGDGYPRNLSNIAPLLIKGKRFKISGRVCMDQIMVDVGDLPVEIGDEVTLIGAQGKQRIMVEELAHLANTIPYEIVCGLGNRVPRIYI